ncbi:PREDICTED: protein no-on-transient A-like [Amphimedon queenslandica]|uniref:Nucleoporin NUP42 n=2 Tax=Amphimedon queenslandica TaxID=400682 RepID=A0AAN0JI19_AMPQE|nr:PREDICTED: protein no-on-transient A-like [Amphimedon queenslandica]|eukprot:XP_019856451.1 PREDICTED: protein no-on-transient A-like [Amphimedon queenslandica]
MAKQREVCKFYLQDRCHYGANCRFLHPPKNQQQFGYGHSSNTGRFDNGRNWGDRPVGRGGNPYAHVQQQNYRGRGGGGGWGQRGGGGGWSQRGDGWSQRSENWSGGNNWRGGGGGGNWHNHENWRGRGRGNWSGTSHRGGSGANWFSNNEGRGGGGGGGGGNWSNPRTGGNLKSTSWFDGPSTRHERRVSWEDEVNNMVIEVTSTEPTSANQIVAAIKEDLSNWEKGSMWPLSCYSPAPSGVCPNLTNMEDHSMEEIRYLAYEAQANGTLQQYIDNVRKEYEKQQRLFQQYQSTTTDEIIHFVTGSRPYTTPASVRTGSHSSLVGAGTNGLVTPVKDLFGVKETKQNSTHSSDSTTTQQISDTDLKAFQADRFVGGAIPETPPPTNLC